MAKDSLEAKIKALEEKVKKLEVLQDVEEIKKLQRAYGYYIEHWMAEDVIDLFSDSPDVIIRVMAGIFYGKEGVKRFFRHGNADVELKDEGEPRFLHQVMQLSPIIDIDPNGKKAKGRWYGFGSTALPAPVGDKVRQGWINGIYENEYVKENGKWKILKLYWYMTFHGSVEEGWVEPSKKTLASVKPDFSTLNPDAPSSDECMYPSGFITPFHFDNPVSGR